MTSYSDLNNQKEIRRVTLIGSAIDLFLGIIKILFGKMFNSQALIVDGIHSFSDIFTDIFVLIMAKASYQKPDKEHPYGHHRFETFGTIIIGVILIGVAGALAYDNGLRLMGQIDFARPGNLTIVVAIISIILKEWTYRFSVKIGKRLNSNLLIANAWHSRTDAISSVIVLIGLIGSILGNYWFDKLAAVGVALMIGKIGVDFIVDSFKELAETSVSPEKQIQYSNTINEIHGVKSFHNLRSRSVGSKVILDVNVEVDPRITVSEGHQIASWVAKKLIDGFDEVIDVTVHTDVEDDMKNSFNSNRLNLLPLPQEIKEVAINEISKIIKKENILDLNLHYKSDKIDLVMFVDKSGEIFSNRELEKALEKYDWFNGIKVYINH